ncbi:MAG: hypothetical protein M9962_06205 [Oligoflexia bacterium]|nr:hypothetical protein [Oligoflexia bacterium]
MTCKKFNHFFQISFFLFFIFGLSKAQAFQTDNFKGTYDVLSKQELNLLNSPFVLYDVDRLEIIWAKYSDDALPPDLVKHKDEPTIIVGFSHEPILFLTFERNALVGSGYVAIQGNGNDRLELKLNPNQQNELALRKDGRVFYYRLGPKQNLDSSQVRLESFVKID